MRSSRIFRFTPWISCFFIVLFFALFQLNCSGGEDPKDAGSSSCELDDDCKKGVERCFRGRCTPKKQNLAPQAEISVLSGSNTVKTQDLVELDGANSYDEDGDTLSYNWSILKKPDTSKVTLEGATGASAKFTPDVAGKYEIQLVVNDGSVDSDPAKVEITAEKGENFKPEAKINPEKDTTVNIGDKVALDGSGSTDKNKDPLTYKWQLVPAPGSTAKLSDPANAKPSFTADKEGDYKVTLIVNDGTVDSDPVSVTIKAATGGNDVPKITAIDPVKGPTGASIDVKITGEKFQKGATITFNNRELLSTFVSATELKVKLVLIGVNPGKYPLQVKNSNGNKSQPVDFEVISIPTPEITSLSPNKAGRGARFVMKVNGKNFVQGAKVFFSGTVLVSRFKSDTLIEADVDLSGQSNGTYPILVRNPGGVDSKSMNFEVTDPPPPPTIKIINPDKGKENSKIDFTVYGTLFDSSAKIMFNGKAIGTKFVSSSELKADPKLDLTGVKAGLQKIQVQNLGGSLSNAVSFTVIDQFPPPQITSVRPSTGYPDTKPKVVISGQNFDAKFKLFFNGKQVAGATLNATTKAIEATFDLTGLKPGAYKFYVENPGGAGKPPKKSAEYSFTVQPLPPPRITSVVATGLYSNYPGTITVKGVGFTNSTVVQISKSYVYYRYCTRSTTFVDKPTSYVSGAEVKSSFTMPQASSSSSYRFVIRVRRGTTYSNQYCIIISASKPPIPSITSLDPVGVQAGTNTITVKIRGSNLYNGGKLYFNKKVVKYTYRGTTWWDMPLSLSGLAVGSYDVQVISTANFKSNVAKFSILKKGQPLLRAVSPTTMYAGTSYTMTLTGSGFDKAAKVEVGGKPIVGTVTYLSSTSLRVTGAKFSTAQKGSQSIVVVNPGSNKSNPVAVTINVYPPPVLSSISPTSVEEGSTVSMYIRGSSFRSGMEVEISDTKGTKKTFKHYRLYSTYAYFNVDYSAFAQGTVTLKVKGPGGTYATRSFTVTIRKPSPPSIRSISPTTGYNNQTVTLTISGSRLGAGTIVVLGTKTFKVTRYISTSSVQAQVDLRTYKKGIYALKVQTVVKSGTYNSNAVNFIVLDPPKPLINYFTPMFASRGGKVTVNIYGSNFNSGTIVKFKNTTQKITYRSGSTTLRIELDLSQVVAGDYDLQVENSPTTKSGVASFLVTAGVKPTVTYVNPAAVYATNTSTTVYIYGTNFDTKSKIEINGSTIASTITSTRITINTPFPAGLFPPGSIGKNYPIKITNSQGQSTSVDFWVMPSGYPLITYTSPTTATANTTPTYFYIYGPRYVINKTTKVYFGSSSYTSSQFYRSTSYIRFTRLRMPAAGVHDIVAEFSGRKSNVYKFRVTSAPVPVISYIRMPYASKKGSPTYSLEIRGSYFSYSGTAKAVVVMGTGQVLKPTYVSSSLIRVNLPLQNASTGAQTIKVRNPGNIRAVSEISRIRNIRNRSRIGDQGNVGNSRAVRIQSCM